MDIQRENVDFGDYCSIEQKRYGAPNEFYGYKVVNRLRSNTWISVPVDAQNSKPKRHDEVVDVVEVISCTAGCDVVERFRVNDLARAWQAAKVDAVPAWVDYSKQSPRIDGRYQVFIAGEQLTADYETPFGFSSAEDGTALIQELISHWSLLPEEPTQEQSHD